MCSRPTTSRAHASGFTLLEVLVALVVIAFALAAVIRTAGSAVANIDHMQNKTLAHWVAMNRMAEIQLAGDYPSTGKDDGETEMAGREWAWESEVEDTANASMRRVEISVRRESDAEETALAVLTGFVREPPQGQAPGGLDAGGLDSGGLN